MSCNKHIKYLKKKKKTLKENTVAADISVPNGPAGGCKCGGKCGKKDCKCKKKKVSFTDIIETY